MILPNYNGKELLQTYIPFTLKALKHSKIDYEFIVIDDCSTDDSVEFLQQNYPNIKILANGENRGFSFSCNSGIQAATMDLIFLLNSDIKLTSDYFEVLLPYFDNPDTFGVMGKILTSDGKDIEVAARYPIFNGSKLKSNQLFYIKSSKEVPTIFLSGANSLIDRHKLQQLDGFDEIYSPFYSEDVDLGIRAWKMGWFCHYEHEATCFHLGSHTTKTYFEKSKVKEIYFRNRMIFHAIHLDGKDLKMWRNRLVLLEVLPKMLLGQFWIWKAYVGFLAQHKQIQESRENLRLKMMSRHGKVSLQQIILRIQNLLVTKQVVTL